MVWLVWALVVAGAIGLFALVWWTSGRARAGGVEHHYAGRAELEQIQSQPPPSSYGGGCGFS
jgi:hypothetical protein